MEIKGIKDTKHRRLNTAKEKRNPINLKYLGLVLQNVGPETLHLKVIIAQH